MNSIEKEEIKFFVIIFLIDFIIFYSSHYFFDSLQLHKKNKNFNVEEKIINTDIIKNNQSFSLKKNINQHSGEKKVDTIEIHKIIKQDIQKSFSLKEKSIEYPIEIDDDKKEEYDFIYHLYR